MTSETIKNAMAIANRHSTGFVASGRGFNDWSEKQVEYHERTLGFLGTSLSVLVRNLDIIENSQYTDSERPDGVVAKMTAVVAALASAIETLEDVDHSLRGHSADDIESGILL